MRDLTSPRVLTAILLLGVLLTLSRADKRADLAAKLEEVEKRIQAGRAAATIVSRSKNGEDRTEWAYSGNKRYASHSTRTAREQGEGSSLTVMAFDGASVRFRDLVPRAPDNKIFGQLTSATEFMGVGDDPVYDGYQASWQESSGYHTVWTSYLVKQPTVRITWLKNGKVRLDWRHTLNQIEKENGCLEKTTAVVLDPQRSFMHEWTERFELQGKPRNLNTVVSNWTRRVRDAANLNGIWIPTLATVEGSENVREVRVSNLRTQFNEDIFGNVFRPGDIVRSDSGQFEVQDDGSLRPSDYKPAPPDDGRAYEREYWTYISLAGAAVVAIFLAGKGLARLLAKRR